jgi:DNA adenine methylase
MQTNAADMDDNDHIKLADFLHGVQGAVIISGYDCDLYRALYNDWARDDHPAYSDRGKKTVESLWLNGKAKETS